MAVNLLERRSGYHQHRFELSDGILHVLRRIRPSGHQPTHLAFVVRALAALCSEGTRSEEHTSELQSLRHLVCRLLLEKNKNNNSSHNSPISTCSVPHATTLHTCA